MEPVIAVVAIAAVALIAAVGWMMTRAPQAEDSLPTAPPLAPQSSPEAPPEAPDADTEAPDADTEATDTQMVPESLAKRAFEPEEDDPDLLPTAIMTGSDLDIEALMADAEEALKSD